MGSLSLSFSLKLSKLCVIQEVQKEKLRKKDNQVEDRGKEEENEGKIKAQWKKKKMEKGIFAYVPQENLFLPALQAILLTTRERIFSFLFSSIQSW